MHRSAKLALSGLLLFVLAVVGDVASAQVRRPATENDVRAMLAKNPELTTGFTTQDGTKARVIRALANGVVIETTDRSGRRETVTFNGPPTVMSRGFFEDLVIMLAKAGAFAPKATSQKCESTVTVTQHPDGSTTTTVKQTCSAA